MDHLNFDTAMESFRAQLASEQRPNTVRAYGSGLRKFRTFLSEGGRDQLDVQSVIDFAGSLNGSLAPATKANYLAAVSRFYHYLIGRRWLELDAYEIERLGDFFKHAMRIGERLPHLPSDEAIRELRKSAHAVEPKPSPVEAEQKRRSLQRLRNIAIVELLRTSGMRVGELVGLRIQDLDRFNRSARVTGKGNKEREVFFDAAAWRALMDYLGERGETAEAQPVFARHNRNAGTAVLGITTDTVRDAFNAIVRGAGIDQPVTPHWLRHAFATRMLDTSNNLALVQDMLGHSSPQVTRVYAKVSSRRMQDAHKKAFE